MAGFYGKFKIIHQNTKIHLDNHQLYINISQSHGFFAENNTLYKYFYEISS